jgi:hypothetical protein
MAFNSSKITAITGATGAQGPAGNDGSDGATGPQGPTGTMDLTADQSWTGSQRATIVTGAHGTGSANTNSGSFDMNAGQNFKCTPTALVNIAFTNEADGQSGYIILVNGSAYAHTKDTDVEAPSGLLTDISAAGTFLISYLSDGTTTYLTNSKVLS